MALSGTRSGTGAATVISCAGFVASQVIGGTVDWASHTATLSQATQTSVLLDLTVEPSRILTPGTGWTASTDTPALVGGNSTTDTAGTASVIAIWDVPNRIEISTPLNVGVIPDHGHSADEIDYVAFAVEGGDWLNISTWSANLDTENTTGVGNSTDVSGKGVYSSGIIEPYATIDPDNFTASGPKVVRAIAYPKVGRPFVLPDLIVNVDKGDLSHIARYVAPSPTGSDSNTGTSSSYPLLHVVTAAASIASANGGVTDGGIIYLMSGAHDIFNGNSSVNASSRYLTIQPAPGLTRADVTINGMTWNSNPASNNGLRLCYVAIKNITLNGWVFTGFANGQDCLWLDGCEGYSPAGRFGIADGSVSVWPNPDQTFLPNSNFSTCTTFVTNCYFHDMQEGPGGITLFRNTKLDVIAEVGLWNFKGAINTSVEHLDNTVDGSNNQNTPYGEAWAGTPQLHGDGAFNVVPSERVVMYGVLIAPTSKPTGLRFQNVGGTASHDVAVIKCAVSSTWSAVMELERPYYNFHFNQVDFSGAAVSTTGTLDAHDVVFDSCTFGGFEPPTASGVTVR